MWSVVVYDSRTQAKLSNFSVGGEGQTPRQVVLAGTQVIANLESRLVAYDLDGSNSRQLAHAAQDGAIIDVAASRDGTKVAFTEQTRSQSGSPSATFVPYGGLTDIVVLDVASGREVLRVPQSAPGFTGYVGQAGSITWRDDGKGFVVGGYTYSESPGGLATVLLDGSVHLHKVDGFSSLSPNGRYLAIIRVGSVCQLSTQAHDLAVIDLDTNAVLSSVQSVATNLIWQEWAPDGSELLYQSSAPKTQPTPPACGVPDPTTTRWGVLHASGQPPSSVSDPFETRRTWYGDQVVEYRCGDVPVFVNYCPGSRGVSVPASILLNGVEVARDSSFRLVGFLPATTASGTSPDVPGH
jgi:dipeptidyl aminopeptidase/acylaminoacyl peptidase